ncbi:Hsp70 family protein [Rhodococcus spelaei]|uniref:Hsp70 family protein n=1 Tax=Rhodococcus spelaei TaxID=2546320 RepID=A0A541BA64_9NOCA|nr:Hsp70 family protein [Rhodococcus spelaei]TQF69220.1 Hsp70 family protein [Rhodococcus spelaei]
MSAVLGVSVGASAVRMATPAAPEQYGPTAFLRQDIAVDSDRREELAAQSIGVLLEHDDHANIGATAVTYDLPHQADALHEAMGRQRLHNYHLVPSATAVITLLEATGQIGDAQTVVLYDLGSSGVTISVVDRYTRSVLVSEHSTVAGGDYFDWIVREQQHRDHGLGAPADEWAAADLAQRCRAAKEQLSESDAVCLPGDGGLILLTREKFESLVAVPVEGSARLAREVIAASGRHPDVVVLLGGGSRIPLVQSVLRGWLALPTVVPAEPEMVAAQGAALLATPVVAPAPVEPPPVDPPAPVRGRTSKRQLMVAGAAAAGLVVVAGVGLALGGGNDGNQGAGGTTVATEDTVPPTTAAPTTTAPTTPTPTPEPAAAAPARSATTSTPPPPPPPPATRYLNLPAPIQIEVPPGIQLPPGMVR